MSSATTSSSPSVAQCACVRVERRARVADHLLVIGGDPVEQLDARVRVCVVRDHHLENVDEPTIVAALDAAFGRYATERMEGEGFGDFAWRAGLVGARAA